MKNATPAPQELDAALSSAGLAPPGAHAPGGAGLPRLWAAVCGVWASKWGDRAWLSRAARGVEEGDLSMSVLIQQARFGGGLLGARVPIEQARGALVLIQQARARKGLVCVLGAQAVEGTGDERRAWLGREVPDAGAVSAGVT